MSSQPKWTWTETAKSHNRCYHNQRDGH